MRVHVMEVEDDPDLRVGSGAPDRLHCPAVREQQVMGDRNRLRLARMPGGVLSPRMSYPRVHPRLVVRRPEVDAIAEARSDRLRVVDERLGRRALAPAALVLEYLRRVPVEEGREGLDPLLEQRVDEPVVEVES